MAIALGLGVALLYGASDFYGGLASRRAALVWVLLVAQATGLVLAVLVVLVDRHGSVSRVALLRGGAAGLIGVVGLGLLYYGLAMGTMSVVAPVAAAGTAAVPVVWGLATGERAGVLPLVGVAVALLAIVLIARGNAAPPPAQAPAPRAARLTTGAPPTRHAARLGVATALASGACFGAILVILSHVNPADGFAPLVAWRVVSLSALVAVAAVTRPTRAGSPSVLRIAALTGALEIAGNGLYMVAARHGLLTLVGVLSSLYPAGTVSLAAVVLGERLRRAQLAGLALALASVVLIAA